MSSPVELNAKVNLNRNKVMSINATIHLPPNVKIQDIADVIAVSTGLSFSQIPNLPGISVSQDKSSQDAKIRIVWNQVEGLHVYVLPVIFYDSSCSEYRCNLSPPSTAFWLALGKRLIHLFGGRMKFRNDQPCGHLVRPRPEERGDHSTSKRLGEMSVLSESELNELRHYSAYPSESMKPQQTAKQHRHNLRTP